MSFDVKNIEPENLDFKKLVPVALILIIGVVASIIFVYYWFTFEKDKVMQEQFLGKPSIIKENFDAIEKEKFEKFRREADVQIKNATKRAHTEFSDLALESNMPPRDQCSTQSCSWQQQGTTYESRFNIPNRRVIA